MKEFKTELYKILHKVPYIAICGGKDIYCSCRGGNIAGTLCGTGLYAGKDRPHRQTFPSLAAF